MSEVAIVLITMLLSFVIGAVGMLMFGGKLTFNYLKVKFSRGKCVLVMAKTPFGWRSFVAKKDRHLLNWLYDKKQIITDVTEDGVHRFLNVAMVFIDTLKPNVLIKVKEGALFPSDFDSEVFNNILIRALTRPEGKTDKMLKNLIVGVLFLSLISLVIGLVVLSKIGSLAAGGVI